MKKNSLTLLLLLSPLLAFGQSTVAIGDFENRTNRMYLDSWADKIPEFLYGKLSQSSEIVLVERKNLNAILEEQTLGMTGLVDTTNAQEVGRLLSAQYVITGGLFQLDDSRLKITAKIINVKSGKTISEQVEGPSRKQLPDMVNLLADNLIYQLTGNGTRQEEIKLTHFPTKPFLWSTIASGMLTFTFHKLYLNKRDAYQTETQLDQFDSQYDAANTLYRMRNGFGIVTGIGLLGTVICWANNMQPEVIQASGPQLIPYLYAGKQEITVGFSIYLR